MATIFFMSATEAIAELTSSRQFTSGEILRIYDSRTFSPTLGDGRTVGSDASHVYADFRYRHWRDDFYDWVAVRINGDPESDRIPIIGLSDRTPIAGLPRYGDTVREIPVDVSGHCGEVRAVVWTGRRSASPVRSDAFRFTVDCESPRITIRAYELGGPRGGRHIAPMELREGGCSAGAGHRFDIQVSDNTGIWLVEATLVGPGLRSGAGREILHSSSMPAVTVRSFELSLQHFADTPVSTRPLNDSTLALTVDVKDWAGRSARNRFDFQLAASPTEGIFTTRIERPAPRSMISFRSSWRITGRVSSGTCAFQPEQIELWHTIPDGAPRKIETVRVDGSGRFSIPIRAGTVPVGRNVFNVIVPLPVVTSGQLHGLANPRRNRIEVQITPLRQETIKKLEPPTPGLNRPGIKGIVPE